MLLGNTKVIGSLLLLVVGCASSCLLVVVGRLIWIHSNSFFRSRPNVQTNKGLVLHYTKYYTNPIRLSRICRRETNLAGEIFQKGIHSFIHDRKQSRASFLFFCHSPHPFGSVQRMVVKILLCWRGK